MRLACERPRKTLYGAILVISVRISTLHVRYVSTVSVTQLETLYLTVSVRPTAQLKPSDAAAEPRSAVVGATARGKSSTRVGSGAAGAAGAAGARRARSGLGLATGGIVVGASTHVP